LEFQADNILLFPKNSPTIFYYLRCNIKLMIWFSFRTVHLGEYNVDTKLDCKHQRCQGDAQEYEVDMAFKHKFYEASTHANDIGMLRLDKRVKYLGRSSQKQTVILSQSCKFSHLQLTSDLFAFLWTNGWGNMWISSTGLRPPVGVRLPRIRGAAYSKKWTSVANLKSYALKSLENP